MKTDAQLKSDVTTELQWDPSINAANVGVAVRNGVVTLTGHLDTYAEKHAVERAVQRVAGVRTVAVELDVMLSPDHKRSDSDIAQAAQTALRANVMVPADRVRATVDKGWITLRGEVDWEYQRRSAEKAVRGLFGVVGVSNTMTLKPHVTPADVSRRIRDALERHAEREARDIEVVVKGSTVTLRGHVDSWAERTVAQGAAWSAPGIGSVINELSVGVPA